MQWNGFVWQQTFNYQLTCNTTTALQCMRDNKFPTNRSDEKFCGDQFLIELQLTIQFHWFVIINNLSYIKSLSISLHT